MAEQLVPLSIRVPQSAADDIDRFAAARGVSKGELLRELVIEALAAKHASPPVEEPHAALVSEINAGLSEITQFVIRLEATLLERDRTAAVEAHLSALRAAIEELANRPLPPRAGFTAVDRQFLDQLLERARTPSESQANTLSPALEALPAQLERLSELFVEFANRHQEDLHGELRQLRQQTAAMLAILHQYRTNGSPEAAAGFAGQLFI